MDESLTTKSQNTSLNCSVCFDFSSGMCFGLCCDNIFCTFMSTNLNLPNVVLKIQLWAFECVCKQFANGAKMSFVFLQDDIFMLKESIGNITTA